MGLEFGQKNTELLIVGSVEIFFRVKFGVSKVLLPLLGVNNDKLSANASEMNSNFSNGNILPIVVLSVNPNRNRRHFLTVYLH